MRRAFVLMVAAMTVIALATVASAKPGNGNSANAPGRVNAPTNDLEPTTDRGPAPKVEVCHRSAEGEYHLIDVNGNALEAHIAHGDALPGEEVPTQPGFGFPEDCDTENVFVLETVGLSAETVLANGGLYDNAAVHNAITMGYSGEVTMTRDVGSFDVEFDFTFENLEAGETYDVHLDGDGGTPGPFAGIGSFVADVDGNGTFEYDVTLAAGTYSWSFWVNQTTVPASVLQTESDFDFTIP